MHADECKQVKERRQGGHLSDETRVPEWWQGRSDVNNDMKCWHQLKLQSLSRGMVPALVPLTNKWGQSPGCGDVSSRLAVRSSGGRHTRSGLYVAMWYGPKELL